MAASICTAALLALAGAASAQTDPQTTSRDPAATSVVRITATGCVTQDSRTTPTVPASRSTPNGGGWILLNATSSSSGIEASATYGDQSSPTSRSGSPSNEGSSAGNRNGTTGSSVSGSTSTARGTSGTSSSTGSIDTEAHGGGVGAANQGGSPVGAGHKTSATSGDSGGAATSYQLTGINNASEFAHKRVEVTGILDTIRANASLRTSSTSSANTMPILRVFSVRLLGDESCQ